MNAINAAGNQRSYGCSFGCGNPYDVIVITVQDGETHFLCIPCYCVLARDMIQAMTDAQSPEVRAAMEAMEAHAGESVPGPTGNRGRKNAPATASDPDLISAYEDITEYDAETDQFS